MRVNFNSSDSGDLLADHIGASRAAKGRWYWSAALKKLRNEYIQGCSPQHLPMTEKGFASWLKETWGITLIIDGPFGSPMITGIDVNDTYLTLILLKIPA